MKRRLLQTLITCVVMSSLIVVPVCASPSEDKETLEAKKSEAEAQAASVNEELVSLLVEFNALKQDMATQEDRIAQAETDLAEAKEEEEKQYEDMKLRIKYMYEQGDTTSVSYTHLDVYKRQIYERADASQPFMGLKSFSGDFPVLKDISIAKNYLNDEELKILNNIVSGYFDFAEIQAMRHNPMHMEDYVEHLDNVLKTTGEKVLQGAGTISHVQAIEKATEEYRKYQVQNLSPVEEEYLESIKNIHSTVKKNSKN